MNQIKKNKFDIGQWVPPNPLVHQMKLQKTVAEMGDKANWLLIKRYHNVQPVTDTALYFQYFRALYMKDNESKEKANKKEFEYMFLIKMYIPIDKGMEFRTRKEGFRQRGGKTYPRLGIVLPEEVYVKFEFPQFNGKKRLPKPLAERVKKELLCSCVYHSSLGSGVLEYFPSDLRQLWIEEGRRKKPKGESPAVFLTEKNWTVLEMVNTQPLVKLIRGFENPVTGVLGDFVHYAPEEEKTNGPKKNN